MALSVWAAALWGGALSSAGHDDARPGTGDGHSAATYEVAAAREPGAGRTVLEVTVTDAAEIGVFSGGERVRAETVGGNGIRFTSIHTGKKQRATAVFARGRGTVRLGLPAGIERGEVVVTKGYGWRPVRAGFAVTDGRARVTARLEPWWRSREEGWVAADAHLHYERARKELDGDWLTMLAANGLEAGMFMVLKGGNVPGIWAEQYGYGEAGMAVDGPGMLAPGEEFRDRMQGHYNLFGMAAVIEPISTGGMGAPPWKFNWPPAMEVLRQTRESGGIGGAAHGARLAGEATAAVEAILGELRFMEIANTHLVETDLWYRLMNCGVVLPPAAGTDLPNYPYREAWQPLFGETRMLVKPGEGEAFGFESWKRGLEAGRVIVTSGPMIRLSVAGAGPGETVALGAGGGEVVVEAKAASLRGITDLEVVLNGKVLEGEVEKTEAEGAERWVWRKRVTVDESCWMAARATGVLKKALFGATGISQRVFAHTGAVKVIVDGAPILELETARALAAELRRKRAAYAREGVYQREEDRAKMLGYFDAAGEALAKRITARESRR